jgi:hypothetical protein
MWCGDDRHKMRVCLLCAAGPERETGHVIEEIAMFAQSTAPTSTSVTSRQAAAHQRQRDLVRASLIACPAKASPTHRRWA